MWSTDEQEKNRRRIDFFQCRFAICWEERGEKQALFTAFMSIACRVRYRSVYSFFREVSLGSLGQFPGRFSGHCFVPQKASWGTFLCPKKLPKKCPRKLPKMFLRGGFNVALEIHIKY